MSTVRSSVIYILADDPGWGDLGRYGHAHGATPQIDVAERLTKSVLAWQTTRPPGPVDPGAGHDAYPGPNPCP